MKLTKKVSIIIYISIIFFLGCSQSDKREVVNFNEVETLIGKKITTINPYVLISMEVVGNFLVVVNNKGNHIFQIYDTDTDSLILEKGKKGNGPGEFMDPSLAFNCNTVKPNHVNILEIFDCQRRRLTNVNLASVTKFDSLEFCQEKLPNSIGVVDRLWYQSDSMICYCGEDEGRFTIFNTKTSNKKTIPYVYDNYGIDMPKNFERFLFRSEVELNLSREIIVAAPMYVKQLDYYDFNGNFLYSAPFEDSRRLKAFLKNPEKFTPKVYINEIKSDSNIIYALNVNCYGPEDNIEQDTNSEILLFNWEGIPIKKYKLDRIIGRFAVDSKNQCIYGYAPFEKDYSIVKYKL